MRKSVFLLVLAGFAFVSCSEQDEYFFEEKETQKNITGNAVRASGNEVVEFDSAAFEEGKTQVKKNQVSENMLYGTNSIEPMQDVGFTTKSVVISATRCAYSSGSPILTGVGLPVGFISQSVSR